MKHHQEMQELESSSYSSGESSDEEISSNQSSSNSDEEIQIDTTKRRKRQRKAIRKRENFHKKHFEKPNRIKALRDEESVLEEGQSEGL